jgi:hypothetical protein
MAFNIADFRAVIHDSGVLSTNKFRVRVNIPAGLASPANPELPDLWQTARFLEYWAEGAQIPAFGLATAQAYRYGYGVPEKRPYATNFTDVPITFIMDDFSEKWFFFQSWINMIFNTNMVDGINNVFSQGVNVGGGAAGLWMTYDPYLLSYKDEYLTDLTIEVFTREGELSNMVTLRECFPIDMSSIDLDWNDKNSYAKLRVVFAYTDMIVGPSPQVRDEILSSF